MAEDTDPKELTGPGEEDFALPQRLFDTVLDAVEAGDAAALDALLDPLHAADIADLLEQIDARDRRALLALWKGGMDGEILSELDLNLREEVIGGLAPAALVEAMRELETDDVVDLVEDLDPGRQAEVLAGLDAPDRVAVQKALAYPDYSAGRLMQTAAVWAPQDWTVGQAIDFLREAGDDLPDQFYHVILVDPRMKPQAYVTLGRILSARRDTALADITEDSFRTFHVADGQGAVAYAFNQYHLISAPVVDDDDRLVGVITIDDAMEVLDEEHEEDILSLAGVGAESELSDSVIETTRQRLPWLAVNLVTAILASVVIGFYEEALVQVVALAVLMPIVASMGGNAGTQSLTVAVRALATRDLGSSNSWRVIRREAAVGMLNGAVLGLVMAGVAWAWFGMPVIGAIIAVAMVLTLFAAAVGGILIPIGLERLGIDPAVASGPFVTTVTDVVGFLAFLGIASMVLL